MNQEIESDQKIVTSDEDATEQQILPVSVASHMEEISSNTEKLIQSSVPGDTEKPSDLNTIAELVRKRRLGLAITGAVLVASLLILGMIATINEDVGAALIVSAENLQQKNSRDNDSSKFWRLIASVEKSKRENRYREAYILTGAATAEARTLPDRDYLVFYGCRLQNRLAPSPGRINVESKEEIKNMYLRRCQSLDAEVLGLKEELKLAQKLHGERHVDVSNAYYYLAFYTLQAEAAHEITDRSLSVQGAAEAARLKSSDFFRKSLRKSLWSAEHSEGPFSQEAYLARVPMGSPPVRPLIIENHSDIHYSVDSVRSEAVNSENNNQFAEAERKYRQAISMAENKLGPEEAFTARCLNSYACFLRGRRRFDEAISYEQRSDKIWADEVANLGLHAK